MIRLHGIWILDLGFLSFLFLWSGSVCSLMTIRETVLAYIAYHFLVERQDWSWISFSVYIPLKQVKINGFALR